MTEKNNFSEGKGLSADFVDNKELRKQAGALNKCGALEKKIEKIIGMTRNELYPKFLEAVESVPVDSEAEKKIPESVINFYNDCVGGTDPTTEEQEAIKAKKAKKESKPRGPNFEKRAYDLVVSMNGKTKEEVEAAGVALYTPLYAAKTPPVVKPEFILERTRIYINIANKEIKKETAPPEEATA